MEIGKQISRYRKEKHITQEQLGEAVGVTNRTVSKWESGVSLPGVDLIPQIASVLEVSIDQLFGREAKEKSKDLTQIIRDAVLTAVDDSIADTLREVLEDVLPEYINNYQSAVGYSLVVLDREKTTTVLFRGKANIVGPITMNGIENKYGVAIYEPDENLSYLGPYDSKEEASAALKAIFKAYSQRMNRIELL
jgi:transcriptional regulator with XRE-family HTH domain